MAPPAPAAADALRHSFDALFVSGWYTNNGPRLQAFEAALSAAVGVGHAVCVCSPESALALTIWGLDPAAREVRCGPAVPDVLVRALRACGCRVLTAGEEPCSPQGVDFDVPGGPLAASAGARRLILDLTAVGALAGVRDALVAPPLTAALGAFPAGGDVPLPEGGVLYTAHAAVADLLRTARNHHPGETFANVPIRFNAKMSEGQATYGLLALEAYAAGARRG